ncbi:MAG TPA: S-layer homology domain-containing protein [Chloroflexia bacterium]|nr:S-layer homology domain-containing protein [Chloroflexia bacterium]
MNRNLNPAAAKLMAAALILIALAFLQISGGTKSLASPSDTITLTSPNNVTIAESDDYATQVLNDPWDMNSLDDIHAPFHYTAATLGGGVWSADTRAGDAHVYLQEQSYNNVYNYLGEKSGVNYPIDTNRFRRLRVRMNVSQAGATVVYWFHSLTRTHAGNSNFLDVQAGWHIYDLDLTAGGVGGSGNWVGEGSVAGMRFDAPMNITGNRVQFDWVRLTPPTGSPVSITWNYSSSSSPNVRLYLSYSPNATEDNEYLIATVPASTGSFTWNGTGVAPGTYYVHAEMNGAWSASGPLHVNTAPLAKIDAPSQVSGEDYAEARLNTEWEGGGQFQRTDNVAREVETPDYYQASATNNDPEVMWQFIDTAHPIDTSRYRYLSMRLWLQAPSARPWSPWNAGPRITWAQGNVTDWQQTSAVLAPYNRWIPLSYDLPLTPLEVGSYGWSGQQTSLRFDVHEEDDANSEPALLPDFFRIANAHLTSRPISGPGTIIRWTPLQGSGSIDIYRDTDNSGYNGTLIASGVALNVGSYAWDTSQLANGTYWVYTVVHDNLNTSRSYSLVPLVVDHNSTSTIFSDVPTQYWAAADINNLGMRGIIVGYTQADATVLFRPGNSATRAQLSKMVVLAAGLQPVTPASPTFADVPPSYPLYSFVEAAARAGIISGYSCGGPGEPCDAQRRPYFRPGNNVTRAQTAKMIVASRGWPAPSPASPTFADVPPSYGLYTYIEAAVQRQIISGYSCGGPEEPCDAQRRPYFRPGSNVTRAQLSKMLSRSLQTAGPTP